MKTEYIEEIKNIISDNYEPVTSILEDNDYTVRKSLAGLHKDLVQILPGQWIQESDVYQVLKELGFKHFLFTTDAEIDEEGEVVTSTESTFLYLLQKKTAAI